MTSSSLVKRVLAALAVGVIGLTMLLYALEQASLHAFAASHTGDASRPAMSVYVTLFIGLMTAALSTYWAWRQWAAYARSHPDVKHLPAWFLIALIVLPGAGLGYSVVTHASYLGGLDQVPDQPNLGFVAFQVIMAALVIIALVLLVVRWSPGYKRLQPPLAS